MSHTSTKCNTYCTLTTSGTKYGSQLELFFTCNLLHAHTFTTLYSVMLCTVNIPCAQFSTLCYFKEHMFLAFFTESCDTHQAWHSQGCQHRSVQKNVDSVHINQQKNTAVLGSSFIISLTLDSWIETVYWVFNLQIHFTADQSSMLSF